MTCDYLYIASIYHVICIYPNCILLYWNISWWHMIWIRQCWRRLILMIEFLCKHINTADQVVFLYQSSCVGDPIPYVKHTLWEQPHSWYKPAACKHRLELLSLWCLCLNRTLQGGPIDRQMSSDDIVLKQHLWKSHGARLLLPLTVGVYCSGFSPG